MGDIMTDVITDQKKFMAFWNEFQARFNKHCNFKSLPVSDHHRKQMLNDVTEAEKIMSRNIKGASGIELVVAERLQNIQDTLKKTFIQENNIIWMTENIEKINKMLKNMGIK